MQSDPFEYLANAGDHANTWLLVGGPVLIFAIVALVLWIFVRFRRAREEARFSEEYKASSRASVLRDDKAAPPAVAMEPLSRHDDDISAIKSETRDSWMGRLKVGLSRTRDAFSGGLSGIFTSGARIDDATLEKVHEVLYRADIGVKTADRLVTGVRSRLSGQVVAWDAVKQSIATIGESIFSEAVRPLNVPEQGLFVLLVVGVNGVGKTTTIGKLAARFVAEGKKVMLCAADTFRAAAIEQLMVWGDRNGVPVIKQHQGADPAAVAFDGVQAAKARGMDVLIIDTAGRLHNKNDLMHELSKINKSIGKAHEGAPHETWIVVDATTGQNAVQQVKAFSDVTPVSGIVVTKLDGTAKGGVIVGIADQFKIPIRYIGVGEKATDLRAFDGPEFMQGILES
jgi:fused signal recognition particle receptor